MNEIIQKMSDSAVTKDKITVFIATYPGGFEHVGDAIRSLLNQSMEPDRIILHINSNKRPPRLQKTRD